MKLVMAETIAHGGHACITRAILGVAIVTLFASAQSVPSKSGHTSPRIFIEKQGGFESFIAAAIVKKKVPAVVTQNRSEATFVISGALETKDESTGGKIARCMFAYCAGIGGTQTASVQLTNATSNEVAWAYSVRKGSAQAYQSSAEAIAKHLKTFFATHPQ